MQTFLEILFPLSDDALTVRSLTGRDVSMLYVPTFINGITTLSRYHDAPVRALVHEAKFHNNTDAACVLATLFTKHLEAQRIHIDTVIPIPLSRARMRARGYNQVERVLSACPLPNGTEVRTDILKRIRNTKPQTDLERKERLINVCNAFGVAHGDAIAGKHILLVDDVTTTGATLLEAKNALLKHFPASVTCIALAH